MSQFIMIRHATLADLSQIKRLADANRDTLGFVLRPALQKGIEKQWMLLAERASPQSIVGFAHYWHRRDTHTTLHELCVHASYRRQGRGHLLIDALAQEAGAGGQTSLRLKVLQGMEANRFYEHSGFALLSTEIGKKHALCVWSLPVQEVCS